MSKLEIGLRQGKLLCQMKHGERLNFITEGLPLRGREGARGSSMRSMLEWRLEGWRRRLPRARGLWR